MRRTTTLLFVFTALTTAYTEIPQNIDQITKESIKAMQKRTPQESWGKRTFFKLKFGMGPGDVIDVYGTRSTALPHNEFGYTTKSNRHIVISESCINNISISITSEFNNYKLWRIQITKKREECRDPLLTRRETDSLFGYLLYNLVEKYGNCDTDLYVKQRKMHWEIDDTTIEIDANKQTLSYYETSELAIFERDLELYKKKIKADDISNL